MSKKFVADKLAIGRHAGDTIWGYEVFPDGRIQLSPGFADRIRSITDRQCGLLNMQENVNRFVADELTRIEKQKREWWSDFADDTGTDPATGYQFDSRSGSVLPLKKDDPDSPSPQANADASDE